MPMGCVLPPNNWQVVTSLVRVLYKKSLLYHMRVQELAIFVATFCLREAIL